MILPLNTVKKHRNMIKYAIERCPNQEYARIHLATKLPRMSSWFSDKEKEDPRGKQLKAFLELLPGVVEVNSNKYSIFIQRGGAFSFEDIIPLVLDTLKKELPLDEPLVETKLYE